jgi:hypothetical protein
MLQEGHCVRLGDQRRGRQLIPFACRADDRDFAIQRRPISNVNEKSMW